MKKKVKMFYKESNLKILLSQLASNLNFWNTFYTSL